MEKFFIYILIIVYYSLVVAYVLIRRRDLVSPAVMFVILQALMFTGILSYINYSNPSDIKLLEFYPIALLFFCVGSLIRKRKPVAVNTEIDSRDFNSYQIFIIVLLTSLSIFLSSYLFAQNGGNAFIISVMSLFGSGDADVIMLRSNYNLVRGIGYITQFRGVILPVLNILLLVNRRNKKLFRLGLVILPFTIVSLLGTGQRGQFAILACVLLVDMYLQNKYLNYKMSTGKIAVLVLIAFVLFSVLTVSNGRISSQDDNMIVGVVNAFVKRIINDNQSCAVIGFRYIDSLDPVWGMDWAKSFMDLLPGKNSYISMESQIFNIIYGSTNGTSPPCIWGSAYYNWSYLGITVFPFLLGYLYEHSYQIFLKKPKSQILIAMYAGKFILLGYWIASTPMYLVNDGFLTLIILQILLTNINYTKVKGKWLLILNKSNKKPVMENSK